MKRLLALLLLIPALAFGQPYYQGANVTNATGLLTPSHGGTGVANTNTKTITLGGPLVTSGAFSTTLTSTNTTTVTLPTTGTLATTAGTLPISGGTLTGNLLFTDATYDIGADAATRPRDMFLSRNLRLSHAGYQQSTTGALISTTATVVTSAQSDGNATGNLTIVTGADHATGTKMFSDLVFWLTGGTAQVLTSLAGIGTPAARTYAVSTTTLTLAMTGGVAYDVGATNIMQGR